MKIITRKKMQKISALFLALILAMSLFPSPITLAQGIDEVPFFEENLGYKESYEPNIESLNDDNLETPEADDIVDIEANLILLPEINVNKGRQENARSSVNISELDLESAEITSRSNNNGIMAFSSNTYYETWNNFLTYQGQGHLYGPILVFPGEVLHVQADMPNSASIDYDLFLFRSDGGNLAQVDGSIYTTSVNGSFGTLSEAVGAVNITSSIQEYYAYIESWSGSSSSLPYTMHVAADLRTDSFEADENINKATQINLLPTSNVINNRRVDTLSDNDWFRLEVQNNDDYDKLSITLDSLSISAGYKVELYTLLQNGGMRREAPTNNSFNVSAGSYYLRVSAVGSNVLTGTNYSLTLVPETSTAKSFSSTLNSPTYNETYSIEVDYSQMSTAFVAIIRTSGSSGVIATVTERESGVTVDTKVREKGSYASYQDKRWITLTKPANSGNVVTYDITVTSGTGTWAYVNPTNYIIRTGDYAEIEKLIGGRDNAVTLSSYQDYMISSQGGNYYTSYYVPNTESYVFRFLWSSGTTITLPSNNANVRFRIVDPVTLSTRYDSDTDSRARRTNSNPYNYCQKINRNDSMLSSLQSGKEYFIEVYTPERLITNTNFNPVATGFVLAVGDPMLLSTATTVTSSTTTITGTSTAYSPTASVTFSGYPATAFTKEATLSGIAASQLGRWQVRKSTGTGSTWKQQNSICTPWISYNPLSATSTANVPVNGTWQVSFQSNSTSFSFKPSLGISYYYEIGD